MLLFLVGVLMLLGRVASQSVASCDQKYSYVQRNGHRVGLITLGDPGGDLKIRVTIWAKLTRVPEEEMNEGLVLEEDRTNANPQLDYYVNFPVKNPLPQITLIKFNGRILCRSEVPTVAGSFFFTYTHTMKGRPPVAAVTSDTTDAPLVPTTRSSTPTRTYPTGRRTRLTTTSTTSTPVKKPPTKGAPSSNENSGDMDFHLSSGHAPDYSGIMAHRPRPSALHTTTRQPARGPAPWSENPSYLAESYSDSYLIVGQTPIFSSLIPIRPQPTVRPITTTPTTTTTTTTASPTRSGKDEEQCGLSVRPRPLMLGGREVEKGDFPWIAIIYIDSSKTIRCGGVLINKRFVVVAAHCVAEHKTNGDKLIVFMGKFDFSKWAERDLQPREAHRIFIHPDFDATSMRNDIALLYLDDEVVYTMFVRPICLGDDDTSMASFPQQMGSVIGWNQEENLPRLALVPVVSQETCRLAITGQPLSQNTFCAGNITASTNCIGDVEGGLVMQKKGKSGNLSWYLRGIASTRLQNDAATCRRGGYVVYTDVAQYTTWIRQVIKTTRPYGD